MSNEFVSNLRNIAIFASSQETIKDKETRDDYIDEINHIIRKAAQRGEFFYTYNGVNEDMVMKLAIYYDSLGFVTSVQKDRYSGSWSLYLNWM